MADAFHPLKYTLAIMLIAINCTMLIVEWFKIRVFRSLDIVAAVPASAIALSRTDPPKKVS